MLGLPPASAASSPEHAGGRVLSVADPALHAAEKDPHASVLLADVPDGLAPAYDAIAGLDVLRDAGEAYACKLQGAGVAVEMELFTDMLHGFVNVVGVGRTQRAAATSVAAALKRGLRNRTQGRGRGAQLEGGT